MVGSNQEKGGQIFQCDSLDNLWILFTQFHITLTGRLAVEIEQAHEYHIEQRFIFVEHRGGKIFLESH